MSGVALAILAAGASRRLGTCKALVDLGGRSPLERLLDAGAVLDAAPPLVVTGADHEAIAAAAAGCELLHNPDWQAGRSGGVRLAHEARPGLDLCLAPVDVPLVKRALFVELRAAWEAAGLPARGWLAPWSELAGERRYGHPVVVGRELLEALAGRPPSAPLRDLREGAHPRLGIPHPGREVLDDLDTRQDLEALRQRLAHSET